MLKATLLASAVAVLVASPSLTAVSPALAQSQFDATGQFTLSFSFGLPGKKEPPPKVGFRLGASNVPTSAIDAADPSRRGLNMDFDRRDYTAQSFSGVNIEFGEAHEEALRLIDNPFSAEALGLSQDDATGGLGTTDGTGTADIDSREDRTDWLVSDEGQAYDWMPPPSGE